MLRFVFLFALLVVSVTAGVTYDIEYGKAGDVSLTLDAYVPDGAGPFPAVIIVHGGSFNKGDKQTFVKPLFKPLSDSGFAWFTINYRLAPKYVFPAQIEDVEMAVRFVRSHAAEYKLDRRKVALMGESAGGHLVSFVGARPGARDRIAAVVAFYAPHDLETREKSAGKIGEPIQQFLGITDALSEDNLRKLREASPISHVNRGMPPYLLIHGTADPQVPYGQSVAMCDAMKKAGARCDLFTVQGAGHGVGGWERPEPQGYGQQMMEWLKHTIHGFPTAAELAAYKVKMVEWLKQTM